MNPLHDALIAPHEASTAPALIDADGGITTYADLIREVARMRGALAGAGVAPGDRVLVQVEKSPLALSLCLGVLTSGAVLVPANPAYTPAELQHVITDAEPALLVVDPSRADALGDGVAVLTLDANGRGSLNDAPAPATAPAARRPQDLAAILYTSGTTGKPKGAMLSQDNLLSNARTLVDAWGITAGDVLIHALPIFHTHGLFVAVNTLMLAGGAMIWLPRFDAAEVAGLMPRATMLMGVPTFYTRLLDTPALDAKAAADMRLFISGSAPLLAETHRAFAVRSGHAILERYGMTETGMNTSNPLEGERRPGTVGPALPSVEVRVMDDSGAPVGAEDIGRIEVRGPNVFQGYWRNPEKTAEELSPDGWFVTGDLGQLDAQGYLTIVGRAKDLIITGGLNVYPKEVEEALDALPGVGESAVIGVPDADFGEAVVAVVARAPGHDPDPQALIAALRDRLAPFKRPKRLRVVDALPRNAMGKVQKAALRDSWKD